MQTYSIRVTILRDLLKIDSSKSNVVQLKKYAMSSHNKFSGASEVLEKLRVKRNVSICLLTLNPELELLSKP